MKKKIKEEVNFSDPRVKQLLNKHGIDPQVYLSIYNMYKKKGIEKTPEEIIDDVHRFKNIPVMQQMGNMPKSPFARKGIPAPAFMQGESKKVKKLTMTEGQFKKAIKEAIVIHEKKKFVTKVITEEIKSQAKVAKLLEQYLQEDPLAGLKNVWQGIKGAGQSFGQGVKQAAGAAGQAYQQDKAASQRDEMAKAAHDQVLSALKNVSQARQKFNQQVLKSSQLVNSYHDAVAGLIDTYQQSVPQMGQMAYKVAKEVENAITQLHDDLQSELDHINMFLQDLQKAAPKGLTQKGKRAKGGQFEPSALSAKGSKKRAGQKREKEADESGRSSAGKGAAMMAKAGRRPQTRK